MAALLLERGADPIARDNRGQTPILVAAARGDDALATMLLLSVPQPRSRFSVGTECVGHAVTMCARGSVRFTQVRVCVHNLGSRISRHAGTRVLRCTRGSVHAPGVGGGD